MIHLTLAVFVVALLAKTAHVQFWKRKSLAASAVHQQSTSRTIPAARGEIRDARGALLAQSREMVHLDVAPREVREPDRLRRALLHAGIPSDVVLRATDTARRWVSLPGTHLAIDVAAVGAMRGVYTTPLVERSYSMSAGTRSIVGRVDRNGRGQDGVELALDSLLRGTPGVATVMKDALGRRFDSPAAIAHPPVPGNTIVLTINQELQDIADRALADAVARMSAEGGDVVVLDPANGDILAMASQRQDPASLAATALTEPYEPGSTLKPFIAATLLQKGRAQETDVVNTFGGTLTINGRTFTDEHKADHFTLADVIRFSSNVGIVQFAERLSAREEFEAYRDFGFGSPTGVPYPVEAAGTLREPARWSRQSGNSLAVGYEIAVTPLQLAAAYVALANGGELLEPALVKEVRSPDGRVLYSHQRRVVRRVVSSAVARRVRTMLLGVVEAGGTAKRADLESYSLAGKTGTARRTQHGRYAPSQYIPTFVGLFPGDNPQFVILVKLDNPRGAYMGGLTAAPVTKAVLEAALASRDASLNRRSLAASRHDPARDSGASRSVASLVVRRDSGTATQREALRLVADAAAEDSAGMTPFVALLPSSPPMKAVPLPPRMVPDVRGLPMRQAIHALHAAGFRVMLDSGSSGETKPAAGASIAAGTVVHLLASP